MAKEIHKVIFLPQFVPYHLDGFVEPLTIWYAYPTYMYAVVFYLVALGPVKKDSEKKLNTKKSN